MVWVVEAMLWYLKHLEFFIQIIPEAAIFIVNHLLGNFWVVTTEISDLAFNTFSL